MDRSPRNKKLWAAAAAAALVTGIALAQPSPADELYRQGQDALADGRYAAAVESFQKLGAEPGAQPDRALYWRAYAEAKAQRRQAALSTLARFAEEHPESPWLDDAQALRLELGGLAPERAVEASEDDLKLYALDALMQANAERAVALLENFLAGDHSLRLKQRALFVLSQTDSPRAAEMLKDFARDGSNRELQREAIRSLGITGETTSINELKAIYRAADRETRQHIIHSLVAATAPEATVELVLEESDAEVRRQGIHALGAMGATEHLETLAERLGPEHRADIFRGYGIAGESAPLLRAIRGAEDPKATSEAIQALAIVGIDQEARNLLLDVYRSGGSREVQENVLQAFMVADDGETLLDIFRTEEDPELKAQALRFLTMVGGPQVDALLEKILEE